MKASNDERAALARRPISERDHRYEELKRRWMDRHPNATPAQYEAAMSKFAKDCGI